jgi:hypothetical protein
MTEIIYVYLPEEAVDVWAPVDAEHVRDNIYRIVDCRGEDAEVQFGKGALVRCRCEEKVQGTESVKSLVAYERVYETLK